MATGEEPVTAPVPRGLLAPEVALEFVKVANEHLDSISAKLDSLTPEGLASVVTVRTIPATAPKGEMTGEEVQEQAYGIELQPTPEPVAAERVLPGEERLRSVAAAPARELTDAEIYDKVALYLDPKSFGPIFLSKPINGRIYVGKLMNYAEVLTSRSLMASLTPPNLPDDADQSVVKNAQEVQFAIDACCELSVAIQGWLFDREAAKGTLLAHIGEPTKWPALRVFSIFDQRDPAVEATTIALWTQYLEWKLQVKPTADEMEKFYARGD